MERFVCHLRDHRELCPDVRELIFARADGQPLRFTPGQHLQLLLPDEVADERGGLGCFYSLSSSPAATFALCIKDDGGGCARYLFERQRADEVTFAGPTGQLVLTGAPHEAQRELLLVATGTGIAPFRAMFGELEARLAAGASVRLLYGVRRPDELLYDEDWRALAARYTRFTYTPTVSAPDARHSDRYLAGRVTAHLAAALPELRCDSLLALLCGVPEMVAEVRLALGRAGVAGEQIRTEY